MRGLAAHAVGKLQASKISDVELIASSKIDVNLLGVFYNSFHLSNYVDDKRGKVDEEDKKEEEDKDADQRTKRTVKQLDDFTLSHELGIESGDDFAFQKACAEATCYARFLCNTRGSDATPEWMETQIRELVDKSACDAVKEVRVLQCDDLVEQGMLLFHAVGKSAESLPRCVIVQYMGRDDSDEIDLAMVGKGVTYDTGGLNLKPTGFIEYMYCDKGGACAVFGALHGILALKPKKNIIFCGGFAENSIDAKSFKPKDVIKSMKGLTVEIGNTDAEGRLVLCDAMTYVQRNYKPKELIDVATLTGACMVALGVETAGLFSNDDQMAEKLSKCGSRSFEELWRLPITQEHRDAMKSDVADLSNLGKTRYGGSCQAAAYLEEFVEEGVKWSHLDIAGPGYAYGPAPPVCKNGTGFGAHLLVDYITKE